MACCSISWGPINGWARLPKYWGPWAPGLMYTVCRNEAQTRQTGFAILCYSATICQ